MFVDEVNRNKSESYIAWSLISKSDQLFDIICILHGRSELIKSWSYTHTKWYDLLFEQSMLQRFRPLKFDILNRTTAPSSTDVIEIA